MIETFIGLEIHIQLLTKTKIFCNCKNEFSHIPNTNVCPVCMGYPGVLPRLNEEAVRKAYIVCRALNCHLNEKAVFERKNYFYPDLPKNYQISQFALPFGVNGLVEIDGVPKIRIHEAHLEEDAGKLVHEGMTSYCDFNRTGTPLLEIVTEPDFKKPEDAELFLQNFRKMVRYLRVCDGNMEEGSMRCDVNVSVNFEGKGLGRKVEIKNLNSFRHVRLALQHEIQRQSKMLTAGETIVQETRLWNDEKKRTESMRSKEDANDYRYFPEPDLPPYYPAPEFLAAIEKEQTELPWIRKRRFINEYKLADDGAEFLTEERERADFFEAALNAGVSVQSASSWMRGEIAKGLNKNKMSLKDSHLTVEKFVTLIKLLDEGKINSQGAKKAMEILICEDKDTADVIRENNLMQMADSGELEAVVDKVIAGNDKVVQQIKGGDQKPIGFLIGQIMKASGGKADPKKARELLLNKIS
ncbi:MAG: Asp-tRNA(Asn)/Glu-tRNA(Gln) amidotransferase subunit GatB [Spirochaetia bacterium]|nr:Asp-tRNA(Asn)/Glu-tRNA(Gln) amidotransferase subunit GatB [Spirochaetia bacterium]